MKTLYQQLEVLFEKLTLIATRILGNSITFIIALILVLFWWTNSLFRSHDYHQNIGDIIFGTTFLSLFIIQKSFNRYSALEHLKMNELISSNESANNEVIKASDKTEKELNEMANQYETQSDSNEIPPDSRNNATQL